MLTSAKVGVQILHRRRVASLFSVFQRPLLFGRVKEPEIADAVICILDLIRALPLFYLVLFAQHTASPARQRECRLRLQF